MTTLLEAYLQQRDANQQQSMGQLQQAGTLVGLQEKLRAAAREQAFRSGLRPDMTQEELAAHAARYGSPDKVMDVQQKSLDRASALEAAKEAKAAALEQAKATAENTHAVNMARITGDNERRAEAARHNKVMEGIQSQLALLRGQAAANQPVTTAEVVDPTDPSRMLKIDARTYKGGSLGSPGVLGVSGKVSDREKLEIKRQFNMQGIGKVIQEAEDILGGKNGDALPTQSGVGTAVDFLGSMVGMTPAGAPQADRLRAIGGALTAKMPRMEGPQSDKDVALYREMAARVGDSTLPVERRKAALDTVKELWAKYERLNPDAFAGGSPASPAPAAAPSPAPAAAPAVAPPAAIREGATATGPGGAKIIFKGGRWVPMQ